MHLSEHCVVHLLRIARPNDEDDAKADLLSEFSQRAVEFSARGGGEVHSLGEQPQRSTGVEGTGKTDVRASEM